MNEAQEFAINLALKSGELLKRYYNSAGIHASAKPDQTVVTEADLAADFMISQMIQQAFPQDGIISEESSHYLLDSESATWVIDPLDGTTNFSLGLPVWGVSIGRLVNGYPDLGVVYFPLLNELYSARRGSGSYLNNEPITARAPNPAQPMSFFACCSRAFRAFNIEIPYKPRIMGSSAYSFSLVARGTALMSFDVDPKVWDLAAAWVLVEEAGGIIEAFDGSQVFPLARDIDYNITSRPVLAAATQKLFEMGRNKIQRKV